MARRVSDSVLAQYTSALKERDELARKLAASESARKRELEALNGELLAALRRVAVLEHENREYILLAENRKQVALEARRELTALREKRGVNSEAERVVHGCPKKKPATWRDARALAANDKELTHASA